MLRITLVYDDGVGTRFEFEKATSVIGEPAIDNAKRQANEVVDKFERAIEAPSGP